MTTGADADLPSRPRPRRPLTARQLERERTFVTLALNGLGLRRLRQVYREFDGDIVASMVLGEVAHHNLSTLAPALDYSPERIIAHLGNPGSVGDLLPCNSYSIAESTGIPRETVRRKVDKLVRQGLLVRQGKSDLYLSSRADAWDRFYASTYDAVNDLLDVAERIHQRVTRGAPAR